MGRDHSDRRTEQLRHAKRQIRRWERAHSTRNLALRRRYNAALGRIRVLRAGGGDLKLDVIYVILNAQGHGDEGSGT